MQTYNAVRINARNRGFPPNTTKTSKYTWWNFLPAMLWEQYHKLTNVYFLVIVVLEFIPVISPLPPWSSVLAILFVLVTSMCREGFEDRNRHKADREVNLQEFTVVVDGREVLARSQDIRVGQIIRLADKQRVPADVVVLKSAKDDATCYVETSQLDGETNLKTFSAPPQLNAMPVDDIVSLRGTVVSEWPSAKLSVYEGRLELADGDVVGLNEKNLVLQGMHVRNTEYIYGVVAYTGRHTKLALNQRPTPAKFSRTDKIINKFVLGVFFVQLIMSLVSGLLAGKESDLQRTWWYLPGETVEPKGWTILFYFLSYFILYVFIIPMSLFFTFEVTKLVQTFYFEFDEKMKHPTQDHLGRPTMAGASAKTSSLNDELCMVKYIFSDKTGTLTQNIMEFRSASVRGRVYHDEKGGILRTAMEELAEDGKAERSKHIRDYLECISLCHTVIPEHKDDTIVFQAQSPDEAALCQAAANNGFTFWDRAPKTVTLKLPDGSLHVYQLLWEIEFSSERRRMSVLVRDDDGRVKLFTKGADNVMMKLLRKAHDKAEKRVRKKSRDQIDAFATKGLRTLVLATRAVPDNVYAAWRSRLDEALSTIGDREELVHALNDELERDLDLVGITAVEDKLQEDVCGTIEKIVRAGLSVWMITGDKQQTAINIGRSCGIVGRHSHLVVGRLGEGQDCAAELARMREEADAHEDVTLIMNGAFTDAVINSDSKEFMRIVDKASGVICCQVTPLQKAQIVGCVKKRTKEVCLAIGDGGNDVSMIQTAHIGVGIHGKEGTQAARAADYAIREFRDLYRLIFVHGRHNLLRNSTLVKFSLFRSVTFFLSEFVYAFFCGFSGQTLYYGITHLVCNMFVTLVPTIFLGLFEFDARDAVLMAYPEICQRMHKCRMFDCKGVLLSVLYAVFCVLVIFFVSFFALQPGFLASGYGIDLWTYSLVPLLSSVLVAHGVGIIISNVLIYWSIFEFTIGIICWFAFVVLENYIHLLGPLCGSLCLSPHLSNKAHHVLQGLRSRNRSCGASCSSRRRFAVSPSSP